MGITGRWLFSVYFLNSLLIQDSQSPGRQGWGKSLFLLNDVFSQDQISISFSLPQYEFTTTKYLRPSHTQMSWSPPTFWLRSPPDYFLAWGHGKLELMLYRPQSLSISLDSLSHGFPLDAFDGLPRRLASNNCILISCEGRGKVFIFFAWELLNSATNLLVGLCLHELMGMDSEIQWGLLGLDIWRYRCMQR